MIPAKGELNLSDPSIIPHAVVVLPFGDSGQIQEAPLRRWLSQGMVRRAVSGGELLDRVLHILGLAGLSQGHAALRLWGQTGERPQGWVAAADPVYLEPMLDHLRLHSLGADELIRSERKTLIEYLQETLGNRGGTAFSCYGHYGYVRGDKEFPTVSVSAELADGCIPDLLLPQGGAAKLHDQLLSEIQMCLHTHPLNSSRLAAGQRPANSLWLWGGGYAIEGRVDDLYTLFSDDPLFRGYWNSCSGRVSPMPGTIQDCLGAAHGGVVIVLPESPEMSNAEQTRMSLVELKTLLTKGRISMLDLVFRDRLDVQLTRRDRCRFWRGISPLLGTLD